jgi:hypothetical protein
MIIRIFLRNFILKLLLVLPLLLDFLIRVFDELINLLLCELLRHVFVTF